MFKQIKYSLLALSTIFFLTSCTTSSRLVSIKDEKTGQIKYIPILEEIEVKLMNQDNEIYNIEDVVLGYKTSSYNPLDTKIITDRFLSSNKDFNILYSEFSKNGIEKDLFQNEFMTFTDDSVLGILAKEYGMKVITISKKDNKITELDYKKVDINFSRSQKHSLYSGFKHTIKHYKEQYTNK